MCKSLSFDAYKSKKWLSLAHPYNPSFSVTQELAVYHQYYHMSINGAQLIHSCLSSLLWTTASPTILVITEGSFHRPKWDHFPTRVVIGIESFELSPELLNANDTNLILCDSRRSLYSLCGSLVIRQTEVVCGLTRGCGMELCSKAS